MKVLPCQDLGNLWYVDDLYVQVCYHRTCMKQFLLSKKGGMECGVYGFCISETYATCSTVIGTCANINYLIHP